MEKAERPLGWRPLSENQPPPNLHYKYNCSEPSHYCRGEKNK